MLLVELKAAAKNVNLGTLGWSQRFSDFGGSVDRAVRQAGRLKGAANAQLRLMSETIVNAVREGKPIQNALFTSAPGVSANAQAQSNGVYLKGQGAGVQAIKSVDSPVPSAWAQVSQAFSSARSGIRSVGAAIATGIASVPLLPPCPFVIIPPGILDILPGRRESIQT